ncbi:MAG: hypothetical protein V4609_11030 [Pseudomonadota bacterium]
MSTEVFRFVTIRPAQTAPAGAAPVLIFRADPQSPFARNVREYRQPDSSAKLDEIVRVFVGSPQFIVGRTAIDSGLPVFASKLMALPAQGFAAGAAAALRESFDREPAAVEDDADLRTLRQRLGDSLLAAAIDASVSGDTRNHLVGLAAASAAIGALAADRKFGKADLAGVLIVLPADTLPLRQALDVAGQRGQRLARQRRDREAQHARLVRHAADVAAHRGAIAELVGTMLRRPEAPASRTRRSSGDRPALAAAFALTPTERGALSSGTQAVLREAGVGTAGGVDLARTVPLIEARLARMASDLHAGRRSPRMVRIGAHVLPADFLWPIVTGHTPDAVLAHPGSCPPAPLEEVAGANESATVPTGHGQARIIGFAELMIVEQKLARYELGEIAHIENVLRGEKRERTFRTSMTAEESVLSESEETEETERDLASTERFELQSETQKVINETASKQAGLTVTASYGPTVDATASVNAASTSAKSQSTSVSSTYARDTTSRAVSRIHKRTLERRFRKTVRETEETNLHAFNNESPNDISGIYRFVEKIYTAQVVNYGKRLLLEFLVPEPAAFWRHAAARQPLEPVRYTCPDPPGYCLDDGRTFVPLQARDIEPDNYLEWASQYGAQDVVSAPPSTRIATVTKRGPDQFATTGTNAATQPRISSEAAEVDIPDGYVPVSAIINVYGETQAGDHKLVIQVQDKQFFYLEPVDDQFEIALRAEVTAKVPITINSLRFYNYELIATVLCTLRPEKLDEWRLQTYFAIMKAYEASKARYDAAMESARLTAAYAGAMGRSPGMNREVEQVELKRACITMMSGQHFESFNAVNGSVAPHGYPEIDLAEARAEARWVHLFEQGLEWPNLSYLFYPYFWSRKDQWLTLAQLTDEDPLFARFLQAGAARVQVPVRPGFERSILNYLKGIKIWDADGNLIAADPDDPNQPQLSMLAELKSQLGNNDVQGLGTVALTNGDTLVTGTGTDFTDADERRRIRFGLHTGVIHTVEGPQRLRLAEPYTGPSMPDSSYSLGVVLVGEPWEVRIPTSLVKLGDMTIT